jgi:hypothetical protein
MGQYLLGGFHIKTDTSSSGGSGNVFAPSNLDANAFVFGDDGIHDVKTGILFYDLGVLRGGVTLYTPITASQRDITFQPGDADTGSGQDGGSLTLLAGAGDGLGPGGSVNMFAGAGIGGGTGGNFIAVAGGAANADAGYLNFSGGNVGSGNGNGGQILFEGGLGGGTGAGGGITFVAGEGGSTGDGGDISFTAGVGHAPGVNGVILFNSPTFIQGSQISLAGDFTTAGAFGLTLTVTAATNVTLPTTGTLASLAGAETLTNKSLSLGSNTFSGTKTQFNSALSDGDFLFVGDVTQYTNEEAQDAVGAMVANSTFISLAYNDATPSLTASLSATGTPSSSTYLRGDNTWATIAGGGDVTKVGTPSNNQMAVWTGDGTLEGTSDFTYDGTSLNLVTGKNLQIAGATVLADSAGTTTLSNIDALDATTENTIEAAIDTLANLTSVQGKTVTFAGDFITSGANSLTLTTTGATNVTLPTTGTLATLAGVEALTNKTFNLTSNTLTGTKAQFDTAVSDGNFLYVGDVTQYTDEMAQDAVGAMVANSTFVSLAYNDTTPSLTASLSATGTPSSTTYLRGDNTWATIAGGGDVTKVGTPVNNQVGVWTGDGTIEGDANLTFDTTTDTLATQIVTVADEAYGDTWSGSLQTPTKNAIYDQFQALNYGYLASAGGFV